MFDNFSVPEGVWTVAALLGLLAGAYNIWISRGQLASVLRRGLTNGKRIIAIGRFARDVLRIIIQVLYTGAGWIAGQLPPRPPIDGYNVDSIIWMLVVTSVLVTMLTLTDTIERYLTLHLMDERSVRDKEEDQIMGDQRREWEKEHNRTDD